MASLVVPAHAESASCAGVLPSLPAALPRTRHLHGEHPLLLSPAASPASIPLPPTPHSAVPTAVTTASKHAAAAATPLPPTPISTLSAPARAPAPATPAATAAAPIRLTVGDVVLTASRVRPGVVDYARVESLAAGDRGAVLWRRRTLYLRVHGGNVHFYPGPTSAHWEPIDRIVRVVASPGAAPAPSGMPIVAASPFRASTPIARRRAAMGPTNSSANSPSTATTPTPTSARAHPYARAAPATSKTSSSAPSTKPAPLAISVPSSTVPTPSPTPSPHRSAPAAMTIPSSPRVMPVVKPRQRRGSAPVPPPLTLSLAIPATPPPPPAVPSIHDMVPRTPPPLELPASAFDPHVHVARPWCLRHVDEEGPTVEDAMLLLGLAMSGGR
ncbi:hypothetical protein GGF32_001651 [Allomyces javanicus]|nr:hypothetical protein GGF32_001651 [Allomyces javanicus]